MNTTNSSVGQLFQSICRLHENEVEDKKTPQEHQLYTQFTERKIIFHFIKTNHYGKQSHKKRTVERSRRHKITQKLNYYY